MDKYILFIAYSNVRNQKTTVDGAGTLVAIAAGGLAIHRHDVANYHNDASYLAPTSILEDLEIDDVERLVEKVSRDGMPLSYFTKRRAIHASS